MALTQTATIPGPGPSWDEEVVPTLRKRLESESRTIARRLSAISMSSFEDSPSETYPERAAARSNYSTTRPYHNGTSNAIPPSRPSQQLRQNSERSINSTRVNDGSSSSSAIRPSRSRTQSQPYRDDSRINGGYSKANGAAPSSDTYSISSSSRPLSPNTNIKPSRIPQPTRNRTASLSSNNYAPFPNGRSPSPYSSPYIPAQTPTLEVYQPSDLWKVSETSSQSTVSVISKQRSGLLNEQPPFKPSSNIMNPSDESLYEDHTRPSVDSEERPFEHWYRGDVSRNGGVGELKVGKRQEMMDIANYGHSMKPNKPTVRNAITDAIDNRKRRKRADSVGDIGERTSFYMDEEKAQQVGRVLDEHPLTDAEGEMSEEENVSDYYDEDGMDVDMSTSSAPLPASTYDGRSTPTQAHYSRPSSRNQNATSRIPGPRTTTPTPPQFQRGMSEPPSLPSSSLSTPTNARTKQQAQLRSTSNSPTSTPQSNGKRGVSPGVSSPSSTNKKSRLNASKATQARLAARKKEEEEAKKRSVAAYPTADDEGGSDMAHAIPRWTEPVPRTGNWDEVVLPAVARKKGLAGHYEEADGSPKVKGPDSRTEPAPGTFGYDHSKYRPPRSDEHIPMDEFGRQEIREELPEAEATPQPVQPIPTNPYDETRIPYRQQAAPSPVPFSSYAPRPPNGVAVQPTPDTLANARQQEQQQQQYPELEDKEGGCCKCVIM
ncbi:hypothetical protein VNI00_003545 [Paramarasmius palmivorus]|uniref:Uncharacterized protein n=1 Tax=Paramarasmius palmivorus TaxID=297713 RepID=A0AAW0DTY9_9AGAR